MADSPSNQRIEVYPYKSLHIENEWVFSKQNIVQIMASIVEKNCRTRWALNHKVRQN